MVIFNDVGEISSQETNMTVMHMMGILQNQVLKLVNGGKLIVSFVDGLEANEILVSQQEDWNWDFLVQFWLF